jgi:L-lactate dehydrogenase complex protein LldG
VAEPVSAREEILDRVRAALADRPQPPSAPRRARGHAAADLELLVERLRDYKTDVRRTPTGAVAATVEEVCRQQGCARLGVPPGLPEGWRPSGVEVIEDTGLDPQELDRLDAVLTGATLAIAETGTLVLSCAPADGRRALTLVPDLHVCVVRAGQVVADVGGAFEILAPLVATERRPLTFVSGPSATSDIELSRVEGVHGPRTLVVLIAAEDQ